jgi:hypothetical protein
MTNKNLETRKVGVLEDVEKIAVIRQHIQRNSKLNTVSKKSEWEFRRTFNETLSMTNPSVHGVEEESRERKQVKLNKKFLIKNLYVRIPLT